MRPKIRNYFLTGLIVTGPLAFTAWISWWFVNLVDGWVKPWIPAKYLPDTYLPVALPGFGLIVVFLVLTLLGFLTANLVGKSLVNFGEALLGRMPVIRSLYRGSKQVFETIFAADGTSFRKVALVEFPVKGTWSMVFVAAGPSDIINTFLPQSHDPYVGVFLPCTPNPTTGYFFYLPRNQIVELPISVEEAAKVIMSAGMIQPS